MKKALRVKDSREFQKVIQKRQFVSSFCYSLHYVSRKDNHARIGISAPTKLGNAVIRNKVKRQVRMMVQEVFNFNEDFDSVIIVKKDFLDQSYEENLNQLKTLYNKVIIKRERNRVNKGEVDEKNRTK